MRSPKRSVEVATGGEPLQIDRPAGHARARDLARLVVWATLLALAILPFADRAGAIGELDQLPAPAGCIDDSGDGVTCADGVGLQAAFGVATSPDGRHVYAGSDVGVLTVFDRDAETGALTQKAGVAGCISATGDGVTCASGTGINGLRGVAVSPDGRNVYVAASGVSAVAVFDRDPATGELVQKAGAAACIADAGDGVTCADGRGLLGARAVVVGPDGGNVYVAGQDGDTLAILHRDASTGALTQDAGVAGCIADAGDGVTCADGVGLDVPIALAVSPDGGNLYVASYVSGAVTVFDRDLATGALSQKPGTAGCVTDTGDGVTCADGRALGGLLGVAVSPDGTSVYATSNSYGAVAVFDRTAATGVLSQKAGPAGCIRNGGGAGCATGVGLVGAIAVAVSPDGANVYATSGSSRALTVFDRDDATGGITQKAAPLGCIADGGDGVTCVDGEGLDGARSPALSPDGRSLYVVASTSSALTTFVRSVPVVSTSDSAVDFGSRAPGAGPGPERDITLANAGTGPLSVAAVALTGDDAAQFTLDAGGCVTTLAPGGGCVARVAYAPSALGTHTAVLTIESDDPTTPIATVALSGMATAPEPAPPGPEPAPGALPAPPVGGPPAGADGPEVAGIALRSTRRTASPLELRLSVTAPGTVTLTIERAIVPRSRLAAALRRCAGLTGDARRRCTTDARDRAERRGRTWAVVRTRTVTVGAGASRIALGRLAAGTYRVVVAPADMGSGGTTSGAVRVAPSPGAGGR